MVQILIYPFVYLVWDSQTLNIQRFSKNFLIYNFEVFLRVIKRTDLPFTIFTSNRHFCPLVFFLILHPNLLLSLSKDRRLNLCTKPLYTSLMQSSKSSAFAGRIDSFRRLSLVLQNQSEKMLNFTKLTSPNLSEL